METFHLTTPGALDAVTFGEALINFVADRVGTLDKVESFTRSLAGAETNFAIGLCRLGLHAGWVGRIGGDPFGAFVFRTLRAEGIDLTHVFSDRERRSALTFKSKVGSGDPEVIFFRKGSSGSGLSVDDVPEPYLRSARHLHCTGIPAALSASSRDFAERAIACMADAGRSISFDPNLRPTMWANEREMIETVNELSRRAQWILPGLKEGRVLTGLREPEEIATFYLNRGARVVVVKLGPDGAYVRTASGVASEGRFIPAYPVQCVIDTVGAGDGFAAGFVSAMLEGLDAVAAVERGNAVGGAVVAAPGDYEGLPTRSQRERMLSRTREETISWKQ